MYIIPDHELPESDYFSPREIEPYTHIDPETGFVSLVVYEGQNLKFSTGVTCYVVVNNPDLTSLVVGYFFPPPSRKRKTFMGGHFWRHYKNGVRVSWKKLVEEDQKIILSYILEAPPWAKSPGKLKSQRYKPHHHEKVEFDNAGAIVAYKYLFWHRDPDVFMSTTTMAPSASLEWINFSLDAHIIPTPENSAGIYAAKTFDSPILKEYKKDQLVLVRLLLSGVVIENKFGYRAEHADILEVLDEYWNQNYKDIYYPQADQNQDQTQEGIPYPG